jgi:hypothetical protein
VLVPLVARHLAVGHYRLTPDAIAAVAPSAAKLLVRGALHSPRHLDRHINETLRSKVA